MCKDTHSVGFIHNSWYRQKISPHLREVKRSIMSICPGIIKWYHYCFLTRRSVLREYRFREDYMANDHRWRAFLPGCRWKQKSWVCPKLLLQDCADFCHWETGLGCGSKDCYWSPPGWNHHQSFLPFVELLIVNKWLWNILSCNKKEHRYKYSIDGVKLHDSQCKLAFPIIYFSYYIRRYKQQGKDGGIGNYMYYVKGTK